jgi:hypothetical protein
MGLNSGKISATLIYGVRLLRIVLMKYGRFIVPAMLLSAFAVLALIGPGILDPITDVALRLFLLFALPAWWLTRRVRRVPAPESSRFQGNAIDARKLICGIAEAREAIDARRPCPDSVQHYRRTLLVMAHQAVSEAGYFKHRERMPEEDHVSA